MEATFIISQFRLDTQVYVSIPFPQVFSIQTLVGSWLGGKWKILNANNFMFAWCNRSKG